MTRRPDRGQGRKSRLLAKMASPGGTHRAPDAAFPTVSDRIGRYRHLSGRWTGSPGPCLAGGRSRLPRSVPMTEGSGRGRSCITRSHDHRGDHGQDFSTPRRTTHVRRRSCARRTGAGRLRAAQAAAGTTAAGRAAADLYSEQPGRSAGDGQGRTDRSGLHTDLPARPGAADAAEREVGGASSHGPAVCADLPARGPGSRSALRTGAATMHPHPDSMRPRRRHPGLRELLPAGAGSPAAGGEWRSVRPTVHAAVHADPTRIAGRV
jgi:hypothetical protein